MTIYTLGYVGWKMEDIETVVNRLDAILVDVRMVPRSRAPIWNGSTLHKRLGDRYIWLREFGNRNYKGSVEQIEIADFPAGAAKLQAIAASGCVIILLCGCPDVATCHRKVLADWLAQTWKVGIVHLTRPDNGIRSGQPTLF